MGQLWPGNRSSPAGPGQGPRAVGLFRTLPRGPPNRWLWEVDGILMNNNSMPSGPSGPMDEELFLHPPGEATKTTRWADTDL